MNAIEHLNELRRYCERKIYYNLKVLNPDTVYIIRGARCQGKTFYLNAIARKHLMQRLTVDLKMVLDKRLLS